MWRGQIEGAVSNWTRGTVLCACVRTGAGWATAPSIHHARCIRRVRRSASCSKAQDTEAARLHGRPAARLHRPSRRSPRNRNRTQRPTCTPRRLRSARRSDGGRNPRPGAKRCKATSERSTTARPHGTVRHHAARDTTLHCTRQRTPRACTRLPLSFASSTNRVTGASEPHLARGTKPASIKFRLWASFGRLQQIFCLPM